MDLVRMEQVIGDVAFIYFLIVIGSSIWINIIAFKRIKRYNQYKTSIEILEIDKSNEIPVSLLVPAYNEEVTIVDTVHSLLELDYSLYEIIIINDGSSDLTKEKVIETFGLKKIRHNINKVLETEEVKGIYRRKINGVTISLIDKMNGGKADSLNAGINYSNYPVFAAIDADCLLLKDALKKIMIPFIENRQTIAVGGNIKIVNHILIKDGKIKEIKKPKELIVCFQIIEYLRAFLTCRISLDKYNMNFIISGAFGAFSREAVIKIGGYRVKTVGEDMELVMRLHKYYLEAKVPYAIRFAADAYCYTQAPGKLKGLKTQRRRWQMGLMQSMMYHPNLFSSRTWFMTKLYYVLTELISPIIEATGMVLLVIFAVLGLINYQFMLILFGIYLLMSTAFSIIAVLLEVATFKENTSPYLVKKLLVLSALEPLGYRQLLSFYRLSAFIGYRKNKHQWGSIGRNAYHKE